MSAIHTSVTLLGNLDGLHPNPPMYIIAPQSLTTDSVSLLWLLCLTSEHLAVLYTNLSVCTVQTKRGTDNMGNHMNVRLYRTWKQAKAVNKQLTMSMRYRGSHHPLVTRLRRMQWLMHSRTSKQRKRGGKCFLGGRCIRWLTCKAVGSHLVPR